MDALYSRLLALTRDGILRYTFLDAKILTVNQAMVDILDLDARPETLTGLFLRDVMVYVEEEGKVRLALEESGEVRGLEYRFKTLKGDDRWVVHDCLLSEDPVTGERVVESVVRDITDRHQSENELHRLAAAVDAAAESVIITGRDGTICYVNPRFERMTGYSREEMIGKNVNILKSGKHNSAFYHELWTSISSGRTWHGLFTNRKKDGTLFQEEATISPVLDEFGKIVNYVAVKRDVTLELELENELRQSQKMEAIGRLARGVAHDFTNMLMVIQTSAEAIKMMIPEHDPSQEHLNRIVEAANKAGTFSGQLLAFSHKQPMSFQIRDLNKVVLGMKDLLRRTLKDNVKLSILTHTEPVYAKLDEGQIEQILVHMIVNAQDAMPNGGQLTVEVGRTFIEKEESTQLQDCLGQRDRIVGGFALLSVSDSGYGMNDEVKHHAFEPFYSTKGAGSSTGLGLSTVYGIIKQHEGHVTLYSNTGVGTCFTVYLPLVSKGREPLPLPPSDPLPNGTGMVLVVEDDPMVRKVLITILQPLGYSILEAEDGLQAVNLSREHTGPIALMITDISMPEMNGKDLAAAVRATRPETKVLFTSGYPRSHLLANKDLTDTDAVISKPLTRQSVARAVCETLGP